MNQNVIGLPTSGRSPAPAGPSPFELAAADAVQNIAVRAAGRGQWSGQDAVEEVEEAVEVLRKAHLAEIAHLQRRAERAEQQLHRVLEQRRAFEMATDHLKTAATKLLDENARLATHCAAQAQQIESVNELLAGAPLQDGAPRTVEVPAVLAALDRARPYQWPAQPPLIVGISVDDSYRVGQFVNLAGEVASHLFVGWAVVLHSTSTSVIEPLFRVNGRPLPESQMALSGWRLNHLQ